MDLRVQALLACRNKGDWPGVLRHGELLLKAETEVPADDRSLIEAYMAQAYRHAFERAEAQAMIVKARRTANHRSTAEAYALALGTAIHADRGAISTAVAWGKEYIEHLSEYPPEARKWAAIALHNLSHAFRSAGDPRTALTYCHAAFERYSEFDQATAQYMKVHEAQIYCDMRDTGAASRAIEGVTEDSVERSHLVDYLSVRATLAYLLGDHPQALQYAVRVLAYPAGSHSFELNDAEMCSLMGAILGAWGHRAEAERYTKRARDRFEMAGRLDLEKLAIWFGGGQT